MRYRQNGLIWDTVKRGAKVAYHGYRRKRLEGKLARARAAEDAAWRNPTGIPGQVTELRYHREGRDRGRYVHRYGPNVRMRLGPGRSRVTLYHARGEPIWADERSRDFDKWVDLDHHRRNPRRCGVKYAHGAINRWCDRTRGHAGSHSGNLYRNPKRRRTMARSRRRHRRSSSGGKVLGLTTTQLILVAGVGYLWYTGALNSLLGSLGAPAATGVVPIGSLVTPANATVGP